MLKREVTCARVDEEGTGPCIHKELTNGSLVIMVLFCLAAGGTMGALIGSTMGYEEGYDLAASHYKTKMYLQHCDTVRE